MIRTAVFLLLSIIVAPAFAADRYIDLPGRPGYKVCIPDNYVQRPGAVADLIVHFHGDATAYLPNVKTANLNAVVVSVQLGSLSSAYQNPYTADTALFGTIINEARTLVRNQADFPDNTTFDKLAVSSFSAGYGAVREVLKQPAYYNDIDALLCLDTIYAAFANGTSPPPLSSQMVNYRNFALDAKNGTKTFVLTHSLVPTFTYCNTAETADDIMAFTSVTPTAYNVTGPGSLQFYRHADVGNFIMYGATGSDGPAHLKHLNFSSQFMTQLPLATVPEPSAIAILGLIIPLALKRRRKQPQMNTDSHR